jgi:hypothetical protein
MASKNVIGNFYGQTCLNVSSPRGLGIWPPYSVPFGLFQNEPLIPSTFSTEQIMLSRYGSLRDATTGKVTAVNSSV